MYKLTERRRAKAEPILEKYRTQLQEKGVIDAQQFEKELRDCWNTGYQEMKDIAKQLLKISQYRFLAAYYMEHSNGMRTLVASEFKEALAHLYGVKHYDSPDRESKRRAFWKGLKTRK
jgi:hypothetical protein